MKQTYSEISNQRAEYQQLADRERINQYTSLIKGIITKPSATRNLSNDRIAYLDSRTNTVVIYDPKTGSTKGDYGTAFIPKDPKTGKVNAKEYFDRLR